MTDPSLTQAILLTLIDPFVSIKYTNHAQQRSTDSYDCLRDSNDAHTEGSIDDIFIG